MCVHRYDPHSRWSYAPEHLAHPAHQPHLTYPDHPGHPESPACAPPDYHLPPVAHPAMSFPRQRLSQHPHWTPLAWPPQAVSSCDPATRLSGTQWWDAGAAPETFASHAPNQSARHFEGHCFKCGQWGHKKADCSNGEHVHHETQCHAVPAAREAKSSSVDRANTKGEEIAETEPQGDVYCRLCQTWLNGPIQKKDHEKGKKHRKNVNRAQVLSVRAASNSDGSTGPSRTAPPERHTTNDTSEVANWLNEACDELLAKENEKEDGTQQAKKRTRRRKPNGSHPAGEETDETAQAQCTSRTAPPERHATNKASEVANWLNEACDELLAKQDPGATQPAPAHADELAGLPNEEEKEKKEAPAFPADASSRAAKQAVLTCSTGGTFGATKHEKTFERAELGVGEGDATCGATEHGETPDVDAVVAAYNPCFEVAFSLDEQSTVF